MIGAARCISANTIIRGTNIFHNSIAFCNIDDIESTLDILEDRKDCEDIRDEVKRMVGSSLQREPTQRPGLEELVTFWAIETVHSIMQCMAYCDSIF